MRAVLPFLLLAAGPSAAAEVERRSSVAGIEIEEVDEEDGGTLVRLSWRGQNYRFAYFLEFWRGNGGVVVGASLRRGNCRSGEAGAIQPAGEAMTRAGLDRRLADYLRECPLGPGREAELRRRLDSAWPAFSAWANEALAAVEAENRAIADHGRAR